MTSRDCTSRDHCSLELWPSMPNCLSCSRWFYKPIILLLFISWNSSIQKNFLLFQLKYMSRKCRWMLICLSILILFSEYYIGALTATKVNFFLSTTCTAKKKKRPMKRQLQNERKYLKEYIDKKLISKIYKKLDNAIAKKKKKLIIIQSKNGQRTWIDMFLEKTQKWPESTEKVLRVTNHQEMEIKTTVRYQSLLLNCCYWKEITSGLPWWFDG